MKCSSKSWNICVSPIISVGIATIISVGIAISCCLNQLRFLGSERFQISILAGLVFWVERIIICSYSNLIVAVEGVEKRNIPQNLSTRFLLENLSQPFAIQQLTVVRPALDWWNTKGRKSSAFGRTTVYRKRDLYRMNVTKLLLLLWCEETKPKFPSIITLSIRNASIR